MMAVQGQLGNSRQATPVQVISSQLEPALIFGMAVGLAVIILGGYGLSWSWTGFKENNTLWDWLRLTVLPIVLGVTAFWLSAEGRRRVEWRWWWRSMHSEGDPDGRSSECSGGSQSLAGTHRR